MTFVLAEIVIKKKTVKYVNAGHYTPLVKMNGELIRLNKGCTFIGAFEKLKNIKE